MEAMKYFSTSYTVKIMGIRYIPSVCYRLDETITPTIEKMVKAGEARMYPEKVRFVNGVAIPVKKDTEVITVLNRTIRPVGNTSKRSGRRDFT